MNEKEDTNPYESSKGSVSIGLLAVVYIIFLVSWRFPDPLWLISYLSFLPIIPVNKIALQVNVRLVTDFNNNEKISGWNWVAVVLGGLLVLMSLIGIFFPEV